MMEAEDVVKAIIERLTGTDVLVLKFLLQRPYRAIKTSSCNIARYVEKSESSVVKSIRKLKYMGLLRRSFGGSWYIIPEKEELVKKIIEALKEPEFLVEPSKEETIPPIQ